jgi:hypothetical protein
MGRCRDNGRRLRVRPSREIAHAEVPVANANAIVLAVAYTPGHTLLPLREVLLKYLAENNKQQLLRLS